MKILLYVISVLLIFIWAIAFFIFNAGGLIHFLIVLALVLVMINKAHSKKRLKTNYEQ